MSQPETESDVARLAREVERLNAHRFVTMHNRPFRLLGFQFAKGLAFGLGTVLGATILVSAIAIVLAQFEWVPIIGSWVADIARQMEAAN